jgi:ribonuclease D/8-oxo-dGTP pyrophosphatase MutT (NUDIX family)
MASHAAAWAAAGAGVSAVVLCCTAEHWYGASSMPVSEQWQRLRLPHGLLPLPPPRWRRGSFRQLPDVGAFRARDPQVRAQDSFEEPERSRVRRRNSLDVARAAKVEAAASNHRYGRSIRALPVWAPDSAPRWPSRREHLCPEDVPLKLIDDAVKLIQLVQMLSGLDVFAVDVESYGERCFYGLVCTIQVSTVEHGNFLIDCLASGVREALRGHFNRATANAQVLKVLHGSEDDVYCLQRDFDIYLVNVFDTCEACKTLQRNCASSPNFRNLLTETIGVEISLDKQQRTEDWSRRPLPLQMVYYAVADAHYLLHVAGVLWVDACTQQREGSSGVLARILDASSKNCLARYSPRIPSTERGVRPWSKDNNFKNKLKERWNSRSRADDHLLARLYLWRDGVAREEDENGHNVCSSRFLIELARKRPDSADAVQEQSKSEFAPKVMPRHHAEAITAILAETPVAPLAVPEVQGSRITAAILDVDVALPMFLQDVDRGQIDEIVQLITQATGHYGGATAEAVADVASKFGVTVEQIHEVIRWIKIRGTGMQQYSRLDPVAADVSIEIPGAMGYKAAHVLIFDRELKVSLVQRRNPVSGIIKKKWGDIGGKPEPEDKDVWATAVREAKEETGWDLTDSQAFQLLDKRVLTQQAGSSSENRTVAFLMITRREFAGCAQPQQGDKVQAVRDFELHLAENFGDFRASQSLRAFRNQLVWSTEYDHDEFWCGQPNTIRPAPTPTPACNAPVRSRPSQYSFYRYVSDASPQVCLLMANELLLQLPGGWRPVGGRRVTLSAGRTFDLVRVAKMLFRAIHGRAGCSRRDDLVASALVLPAWPHNSSLTDDEAAQEIVATAEQKTICSMAPVDSPLCTSIYEMLCEGTTKSFYIAERIDTKMNPLVDTFEHGEYGVITYAEFYRRRYGINVTRDAASAGMLRARKVCEHAETVQLLPEWTCCYTGIVAKCIEQVAGLYGLLGFAQLSGHDDEINAHEVASVFIHNLAFSSDAASLHQRLEPLGAIGARLLRDRITVRPKGTGFVDFADEETATLAIKYINQGNMQLDGRIIRAGLRVDTSCRRRRVDHSEFATSDAHCWAALALGLPLSRGAGAEAHGIPASRFDLAINPSRNERLAKLGDAVVELAVRVHVVSSCAATGCFCKKHKDQYQLFDVLPGDVVGRCPYCVVEPMKSNKGHMQQIYTQWLLPALQILHLRPEESPENVSEKQIHKNGDHVEAMIGMCAEALSVQDAGRVYLRLLSRVSTDIAVAEPFVTAEPSFQTGHAELGRMLCAKLGSLTQLRGIVSDDGAAAAHWAKCVLVGEAVTDLSVLRYHFLTALTANKGELHRRQRVELEMSVTRTCLGSAATRALVCDSNWASQQQIDEASCNSDLFLPECWKAAVGCLYLEGGCGGIEEYSGAGGTQWDVTGRVIAKYVLGQNVDSSEGRVLASSSKATASSLAPAWDSVVERSRQMSTAPSTGDSSRTDAPNPELEPEPDTQMLSLEPEPELEPESNPALQPVDLAVELDNLSELSLASEEDYAVSFDDGSPPRRQPVDEAEVEPELEAEPTSELAQIVVECRQCEAVICYADALEFVVGDGGGTVTKLQMNDDLETLEVGEHPDKKKRAAGYSKALCVNCGADVGPCDGRFALLKARKSAKVCFFQGSEHKQISMAVIDELYADASKSTVLQSDHGNK